MARRNDRRVLRTRKLLRESILALVLEKGYDDISIQDITDRANLGRATFYLHYREKDDLLADLIRQFMEEFIASGPQNSSDKSYVRDIRSVQRLFEYIETRYDVYRILLIGKGFVVATRQLHRLLQKGIAKGLAGKLTESGKELALPLISWKITWQVPSSHSCIGGLRPICHIRRQIWPGCTNIYPGLMQQTLTVLRGHP